MCCRHIQTYSRYVNTFFHTCSRNSSTWYTAVKTCSINVETCQNISIACLDMLQTCSVFPKYPDMFLACWYMSDIFQACQDTVQIYQIHVSQMFPTHPDLFRQILYLIKPFQDILRHVPHMPRHIESIYGICPDKTNLCTDMAS